MKLKITKNGVQVHEEVHLHHNSNILAVDLVTKSTDGENTGGDLVPLIEAPIGLHKYFKYRVLHPYFGCRWIVFGFLCDVVEKSGRLVRLRRRFAGTT